MVSCCFVGGACIRVWTSLLEGTSSLSSCISILHPSLLPRGKRSIMFLPPRWRAHFRSLTALNVTSKEQPVTTRARWRGGSWAYFRDLSIPQWQERVSDVPLASVFLWIWDGVSTCVRRRGERGETLGEDQCDSGMKEPKISFYSPPPLLHSTGTLFLLHLCRMSVFFFLMFFECQHCSLQVKIF